MKSLLYLLLMSVKNSILDIFRKPGKLILTIFLLGLIVGMIFLTAFTKSTASSFADRIWLKGIVFLLLGMFTIISFQRGLSSGDAIYEMSDVNFLFVAPISPRKVLVYGLARLIKTAFWGGFFLLFQGSSLGAAFGISYSGVLAIFFCFIITMVLLSIASLVIYSYSNGNPARKAVVRVINVAIFLPVAGVAVAAYLRDGNVLAAAQTALRSPLFSWTPAMGWGAEAAVSLATGDFGTAALFLGVSLGVCALLTLYICLSRADFYEDVLVATQTAFEKKRAASENIVKAEGVGRGKIRIKATGVGGSGASAIFFKHLRESSRSNPLGPLTWASVWTVAGATVMGFVMKGSGLANLLQILAWTQMFLIGMGRGLKETYYHYIYMIPERSFTKIIWSNLEAVVRVLAESVLIFVVSGIIMGSSVPEIILCILVYTLYSMLLIGVNYLFMYWTGVDISAGLLVLIYTLVVIVVMLPGLAAALIIGIHLGGQTGLLVGLAVLSLWELLAAIGTFALSRGVLHKCDMASMPQSK